MFALTGCDSEETKAAKESFNNEVERVQASYDALTAEIATAEELVVTEERPLDETLKPALEDTISDDRRVQKPLYAFRYRQHKCRDRRTEKHQLR